MLNNTDIMLDTANIEQIKLGIKYFNISGVTTNPTILKQSKTNDFKQTINEIISIIGKKRSLHIQVVSLNAKDMIKEAEYLKNEFSCDLYIKIPVTNEGLIAIKELKARNFKITATGIITPMQILMAASVGADYAAPYFNRIETIGGDAESVIKEASELIKLHDLNCKVLGASFKNPNQVKVALLSGAKSITASYEVIEATIYHPYTDWSIAHFSADFKEKYQKQNFIELYDL